MNKKLPILLASALLFLQANAQEKPKEGWVISPMPDFSYNSDLGFNLGAFANIFYYGDGSTYPNFLHHIAAQAAYTTKGSWNLHTMAQSRTLVDGLRLSASFTVREVISNNFYGFNGACSPFNPALELNEDTRTAYYTNRRSLVRAVATAEGEIGKGFGWLGGVVFRSVNIGDFQLERYNSGNSLYNDYCKTGLIRADEASGGMSIEEKAGLYVDTRDVELVPHRGINAEAYLLANQDLSHGKYSYGQIVAHFRHYISLFKEKIILAYHLALQHQIWGEMPFYNISELATLRYQYEDCTGLGSRYSIRGYRLNRIAAAGYAWSNIELRTTVLEKNLLGQHFAIVLSPFMDLAAITRHYRIDEQKAIPGFYQETQNPLMVSLGVGGKLHMNTNFIMALDLGKGLDPLISDFMIGMASTYLF